MTEKRGVGRPEFKPTAAQRRRVEEMVSCRMTVVQICQVIGVADDTLKKHFADELEFGRARRRAEVVELLYTAARKGNVAAQKTLQQMTGDATEPQESAAEPLRKLGKKEQAEEAANSAGIGTDWGDDLQIPPIVN